MLKLVRTFWRQQTGATAVEFGMVVTPFLVLLFGALQVFLVLLVQQMLETAAEKSARLVLTGQVQSLSRAQFQTSVCAFVPAILKCSNIMFDMQTSAAFSSADTSVPILTYDKNGNVTNTWQFNPGSSGQIVVLRLMYQWPMFNMLNFQVTNLANNSRLLIATSVFKNEVF